MSPRSQDARRALSRVRDEGLPDRAAALTYYAVLSLFPAALVLVALLGVLGEAATGPLLDELAELAPGPGRDLLTAAVEDLQDSRRASGALLAAGLAVTLWAASSYVAAFMRAANSLHRVEERRPLPRRLAVRLGTTSALLLGLAAIATGGALTGGLARAAGERLGLGEGPLDVWGVLRYPLLLLLATLLLGLLLWAAPDVRQPFRRVTPGALVGVLVAAIGSAGFALYVDRLASYDRTYGTLAGVVVFLLELWVANLALLLGTALNAVAVSPSATADAPVSREPAPR